MYEVLLIDRNPFCRRASTPRVRRIWSDCSERVLAEVEDILLVEVEIEMCGEIVVGLGDESRYEDVKSS
jgi:CTP-dependent riboflavin kinase